MKKLAVVVPTLNAGSLWQAWLAETASAASAASRKVVIDSASIDATAQLAEQAGFEVWPIRREDFNHGGTRHMALERLSDCDIVVFLTQDALLADVDAIHNLIKAFDDPAVAVAYGRQLPHKGAGVLASHARLFNYPTKSEVRSLQDSTRLGLKTAFNSNSFAAYRREVLLAVGGFPSDVILSEDMIAAARVLQAGYKVAYCADACVYHSHDYSLKEEFRRYFDIGVLHARESWLLTTFGKAEGEGKRFMLSELNHVLRQVPWRIPEALLRTVLKYLGYRLGQAESAFPVRLKRHLSMHRGYWRQLS